jgi:hypothetical protein
VVVATKTKAKADVRTGKGKGGRRPPVKVKRGPEIPLLPIAVGAILLVLLIGMIVWIIYNNKPAPLPTTAGGVPCDKLEQTRVHYHSALQIIYQGVQTPIPGNIGIVTDSAGNASCFYWLHVHAQNPNVIHIESPANQVFTLGQFFDVWTAWNKQSGLGPERLDAMHVAQFTLTGDQKLVIYVDLQDGKGPQLYTGDPRAIAFKSHEVITLEITPPTVDPPPSFAFTSNL